MVADKAVNFITPTHYTIAQIALFSSQRTIVVNTRNIKTYTLNNLVIYAAL